MAVTGDFIRLKILQDRLQALARGEARREILQALRAETHDQVLACFNEKRDPYGRKWPARSAKSKANNPLLDKSGKLIESVRSTITQTAVKVTMLAYAMFHWQPDNKGKSLPQRAMLPTKRQGLGPIWGDAFLRKSGEVMKAFMGVG